MKAALLIGFGGADKLQVGEAPEPAVHDGEVKVRVIATSINPIDWKLREGAKRPGLALELPAILGRDAAGEVVAIGAGVTRVRVGARVAGLVMGSYGEYVVAKEAAWAEMPASLKFDDAAAIPLVALTGGELIDQGVQPRTGETVLVTGAVGSVGRAAVYTAKARGAKVWAGVRSSQRTAAAQLGAEGVIALDDEHAQLPVFDAIADTVGGATIQKLLGNVRKGGVIATVLGEPPGARDRGLEVRHVWAEADHERLAALMHAVAEGALVIPIAKRLPLAQIRQAHELAERGAGGKVIVEMP